MIRAIILVRDRESVRAPFQCHLGGAPKRPSACFRLRHRGKRDLVRPIAQLHVGVAVAVAVLAARLVRGPSDLRVVRAADEQGRQHELHCFPFRHQANRNGDPSSTSRFLLRRSVPLGRERERRTTMVRSAPVDRPRYATVMSEPEDDAPMLGSAGSADTAPRNDGCPTPILRAMMPTALFYQIPHPIGVPPHDPPRRGQFHVLVDASALSAIPAAERTAVARSAAKTYTRGVYHEGRFFTLRGQLDDRRHGMPGEIVFDSLLDTYTSSCNPLQGLAERLSTNSFT